MKITYDPQTSFYHCCDCGSMQTIFDERQHILYCRGQHWDSCLICAGKNTASIVTYVCASCQKDNESYKFIIEDEENRKLYFCSWGHLSSFVVKYNLSKVFEQQLS